LPGLYSPAILLDETRERSVLTFPALQDRMVVLAAGLAMVLGLAYIVNKMRKRGETKQPGGDIQDT
jgi:flagellar biogenesis protein FliO